jgi:hypothetical protein
MTDNYNTFTDRFARNCAVRRAEEEEQRRVMSPQQRSNGESLVCKTYSPTPQPQQGATMDEATAVAWNAWADAKIANAIRELGPEIDRALDNLAGETSKALDDLADEANKAIGDLREALVREREKSNKLRSDIEVLRVMIRSVGVTQRSKRDVT